MVYRTRLTGRMRPGFSMYTELFETIYPINIKKERGVVVSGVDAFGLGEAVGLAAGDRVMKVNGHALRDFLDWQYYTGSEDRVQLEVIKAAGEAIEIAVDLREGDVWG